MPIRVMHVVESLGVGGLENCLVNLVQRSDPSRFEHIVCAVRQLGPMAERLEGGRAQVLCLGQNGGKLSSQLHPLLRCIRQVKPHVVHSRNWGAIEAVIAARWAGSCSAIHSEYGLDKSNCDRESLRRKCFRRLAFELAHRVFTVSSHLRELLARRTGFPARKIGVIHDGVDDLRFSPDAAIRADCRRELGIPDDVFCIGSIGRLDPVKDHLTLFRAAEQFGDSCPKWLALIVGDGPELPKLQAFVSARPTLKERVRFLGRTDRVSRILNALDAFVLPSLSEESSNSLLEAMATSLPVVATRTGGTPEIIRHDESGLLFPVGDYSQMAEYLSLLYGNTDCRRSLAKGALLRVREHFSLRAMVRQYEQLYGSLTEIAVLGS